MPVLLRHRLEGPPEAPVVVLGPSLGTALEMWNAQVPALTDRWRVLRYDLRGHGGSQAPPGPYSVGDLATDVAALLDRLGLDRVAYCGISLGGAVGQWLAAHDGGRIGALVLCGSAARFGEPATWHDRAARVRAEGTHWLAQQATERWFTPAFAQSEPGVVARVLAMLRDTPPAGYAACCEALAGFDMRESLAAITAPTLVLAGEADPATPVAMARELAAGIAGADLVVVPDAAHLASVEQPALVTAAIREHLERAWAGPAGRE